MKLLLLHGAGIISSRKRLIDVKDKFDQNSVLVYGEGSDIENIKDNLAATSLFSNDRLVILENPSEDFALDSSLITNYLTLIFWFDHEISDKKPIISWVKEFKGQILYFPESKEISVFPFLDYLADGNKKAFLELRNLKNTVLPVGRHPFDVFYFITMVFYLLRSLVAIPKNAPQFVRNKLLKQRTRFEKGDLKNLYKDILGIEFKIKSGLLEKDQAEFLIVNKFLN